MLTNIKVGSGIGGFIRKAADISSRAFVESGAQAGGIADLIITKIVADPGEAIRVRHALMKEASTQIAIMNVAILNSLLDKFDLADYKFSEAANADVPQYIADLVLKMTKDQLIALGNILDSIINAPQARNLISNASIISTID